MQYWADAHTHFVPTDAGEQTWLAERSEFASWQALAEALVETRRFIDDSVSGLFAEFERPQVQAPTAPAQPAGAGQSTDEPDPDALLIDRRLQAWRDEAGTGAAPDKILRLAQDSDDPAASIAQVDDLFRRLGNRGQYLKLLSQDPKLFDAVLPPLFHAPAMASLLHQSAHVVDGLLGRAGALPSAPELDQGRAMAAAAGTYEGKLEAARAWVNEQLYLAYLSVFSGAATTRDAERHLTALAEAALTLVAETVTEWGWITFRCACSGWASWA